MLLAGRVLFVGYSEHLAHFLVNYYLFCNFFVESANQVWFDINFFFKSLVQIVQTYFFQAHLVTIFKENHSFEWFFNKYLFGKTH